MFQDFIIYKAIEARFEMLHYSQATITNRQSIVKNWQLMTKNVRKIEKLAKMNIFPIFEVD